MLTCVTGVCGSGKSTLVNDVALQGAWRTGSTARGSARARTAASTGVEAIDKMIEIDQSPIGRTPRSNPATYTGLFDEIREVFAKTPEARRARLQAGALLLQRQGRPLRGVPRATGRSASR